MPKKAKKPITGKNNKHLPEIWKPLMNDMVAFKNLLDYEFSNYFSGDSFTKTIPPVLGRQFLSWNPEIDMYETKKEVIVEAEIPGCDKKDVKIKINNNMLTISGEKKEEKEIKKAKFYHKEQRIGSFYRSVGLPNYVDVSNPKATCEKGVLKITFPKKESAQISHKEIKISGK